MLLKSIRRLQKFVDRIWYAPAIGLLAALDNLVLVVPTDGILVSSSMLITRRWFLYAMSISIGSTFGALILAGVVEYHGLPWILEHYPGIDQTDSWVRAEKFFDQYGLLFVFAIAATPLIQQPAVILAGLANTPLVHLGIAVFLGRTIKFLIMAYVASHAPKLLKRMWGLKGDLKDAGVQLD